MSLTEIIIEKIKAEGPVSFHDFMDMALYYPGLGYYNSPQNKIGKDGDYYTSPVLSSLFGQLIGKQMEEMWLLLGKKPFTIVEYGAGTGALCYDILDHLKKNPLLFEHLNYCIIEKSPVMRQQEQKLLKEKVCWHDSICEIPKINGCILSNEVLDNFPVHKIIMRDKPMEVFVDFQNGFREVLLPASEALENYLEEMKITLPTDFCTEINLEAKEWIRENAGHLSSGFVLTIDYGFPNHQLYSAKRNEGTIVCYKSHKISDSPYCNIGEQDITAHVNFSALNFWGLQYDLTSTGFTTQEHFLRSLGIMNFLRKWEQEKKSVQYREFIFHFNKLMLDMGSQFKVLIQQKGVKSRFLTGVQFTEYGVV